MSEGLELSVKAHALINRGVAGIAQQGLQNPAEGIVPFLEKFVSEETLTALLTELSSRAKRAVAESMDQLKQAQGLWEEVESELVGDKKAPPKKRGTRQAKNG